MKWVFTFLISIAIISINSAQTNVIREIFKIFVVDLQERQEVEELKCFLFGNTYDEYSSISLAGYEVAINDIGFVPGENGSPAMYLIIYYGNELNSETLLGHSEPLFTEEYDENEELSTISQQGIIEFNDYIYDLVDVQRLCTLNGPGPGANNPIESDFSFPATISLGQLNMNGEFELYNDNYAFFESENINEGSEFFDGAVEICCDWLDIEMHQTPIGGNSLHEESSNFNENEVFKINESDKIFEGGNLVLPANSTKYSIYPNPFTQIINISLKDKSLIGNSIVKIYDSNGKIKKSIQLDNYDKLTINIEDLPVGVYFITIRNDRSFIKEKIVKIP